MSLFILLTHFTLIEIICKNWKQLKTDNNIRKTNNNGNSNNNANKNNNNANNNNNNNNNHNTPLSIYQSKTFFSQSFVIAFS